MWTSCVTIDHRALLNFFRVSLHEAFRYMALASHVDEQEDYLSKVVPWVWESLERIGMCATVQGKLVTSCQAALQLTQAQ